MVKYSQKLSIQLIEAVKVGKPEEVNDLLKRGADPNISNGLRGKPAIVMAAEADSVKIIEHLLRAGAKPDLRQVGDLYDEERLTALMIAVKKPNLEIIRLLRESGASLSKENNKNSNCLSHISDENYDAVIPVLFGDYSKDGYESKCVFCNTVRKGREYHLWVGEYKSTDSKPFYENIRTQRYSGIKHIRTFCCNICAQGHYDKGKKKSRKRWLIIVVISLLVFLTLVFVLSWGIIVGLILSMVAFFILAEQLSSGIAESRYREMEDVIHDLYTKSKKNDKLIFWTVRGYFAGGWDSFVE